MRCLTLADELRRRGACASFLCGEFNGNLIRFIEEHGYPVVRLNLEDNGLLSWEVDARQCIKSFAEKISLDWLVVDNYRLGAEWEQTIRPLSRNIFVIDDLANRHHDCDILLDQNFYLDAETRYVGLLPESCIMLLGPQYTLLRQEFSDARENLRERDGRVGRILVFFGGCDQGNETLKALESLRLLNIPDVAVDVVIGLQNPHRIILESFAATMPGVTTHFQVARMSELLAASDLYIGAAGTTTWERCCLGLPSLVITVADNQVQATKDLAQIEVLTYIGESDEVTSNHIAAAVTHSINDSTKIKKQSIACLALVDGNGTLRCAETMLNKTGFSR